MEVQISNLKFQPSKPNDKLSSIKVQTTDIQPVLRPSDNSSETNLNMTVRGSYHFRKAAINDYFDVMEIQFSVLRKD